MSTSPARPRGKKAWFKAHAAPVAGLLLSVGIMAVILWVKFSNPDVIKDLQHYGYLGAFVISVILNGTVLLPVSNMAIIVSLGGTLPVPGFVGLAGGAGAAIGELTAYLLGRSGRGLIAKNRIYTRLEGWVRRWGWVAIFFLSAFPFVFDVVGLIAGALRMPVWRFFLACWAGRTASYVTVAYAGSIWFREIPWWSYLVALVVLLVVGLLLNYRKSRDDSA